MFMKYHIKGVSSNYINFFSAHSCKLCNSCWARDIFENVDGPKTKLKFEWDVWELLNCMYIKNNKHL